MKGQWASPVAAVVKGKPQVIFPGGDGWLYAFEPASGKLLWKFDCNPKDAKGGKGGKGTRNYLVATPVVHDDKLYVNVGQDPEDGDGVGHLWCVDVAKEPKNKDKDLSPVKDNFDPKAEVNKDSGLVWHFGGLVVPEPKGNQRKFVMGRSISTVAIHDGLLYTADVASFVYCLDSKTGKKHWVADTKDGIWSSPYYADGKVFIGTTSGDLYVYAHGKTLKQLDKIDMESPLYVAPVADDGVLYFATSTTLFALASK